MSMVERIKAVEEAFRITLPGEPCHNSECPSCAEDRMILATIAAALAEAEKDAAAFQRAREAWTVLSHNHTSGNPMTAYDILDEFLGGGEGEG